MSVRNVLVIAVCGLALVAARNRPRLADMSVTVTPAEVTSPVTPDDPNTEAVEGLVVCVAGFFEGNLVHVRVPWIGSPDANSGITTKFVIDATGGGCMKVPRPVIGSLVLEAGVYDVTSSVAATPADDTSTGPSTTLTVVP